MCGIKWIIEIDTTKYKVGVNLPVIKISHKSEILKYYCWTHVYTQSMHDGHN